MSLAKEATDYDKKLRELNMAIDRSPNASHADALRTLRRTLRANTGGNLSAREEMARMFDKGMAGQKFTDKTNPARQNLLKLDIRTHKPHKLNPNWANQSKTAGSPVAKMLEAHQALTGDKSRETANRIVGSLKGRGKGDIKSGLKNLQGFKGLPAAKRLNRFTAGRDTPSDNLASRAHGMLGLHSADRSKSGPFYDALNKTPGREAKHQSYLKTTIKYDADRRDIRKRLDEQARNTEKIFGKPTPLKNRIVGSGQ